MITSGALRAGDRLPREADLAADLGLSRSSLREAVRALSLVNILDVRQGDGTYVTSLQPHLLLEALSFIVDFHRDGTVLEFLRVRRILEPAAVAMAAERITETECQELRVLLDSLGPDPDVRRSGRERCGVPPADHRLLREHRPVLTAGDLVRADHPGPDLAWPDPGGDQRNGPWPSTGRSWRPWPRTSPRWPGPGPRCTSPGWSSGSRPCRDRPRGAGHRPPGAGTYRSARVGTAAPLQPARRTARQARRRQPGHVLGDLGGVACPGDNGGHGGVAQHEMQRGGADRHAVAGAYGADPLRPLQQAFRRGRVVVGRAGAGVGENPAVEDARGEDRDAPLLARGQ